METNTQRPTLAVAMIVKNEAGNLQECLASVSGWADEIVVLDAGSNDETVNIAEEFNARVFVNAEWPGFGKQRQLAQSHVQSDWVFWLDADERVSAELRDEILAVLQNPPANTVFAMPRLSWAFGRFIHHLGWYPDHVLRLYPTRLTQYDDSLVHEKVHIPAGVQTQVLTTNLLHYTYRDMPQYLAKMGHYASLWATQKAAAGKRSSIPTAILHGIGCFMRMYILRRGFLDGAQGLLIALTNAYFTFAKYADLWVRNKQKP
jgi:(heptosyl)LPS beta-1,4-glucosyltransferase